MKNEYSEIYNYFFDKTIRKGEVLLKNLLLFYKNEGKTYSYLYNPTLLKIEEMSRSNFYLNSSNKFNSTLNVYDNRSNIYSSEFANLIFQKEMLNAFNFVENIKNNYDYKKFIAELGQVMALKEIARKFRKFDVIYKFMFQLNDFSEFKLWNYSKDVESHPEFKKLHRIIYPKSYENIKMETGKAENIENFRLKKEYEKNLKPLFNFLIEKAIITLDMTFESFESVLLNDWYTHNINIIFNSTQELALLVPKIKFAFDNLSDRSIETSKLFKSPRGTNITSENLRGSRKIFNQNDKVSLDRVKLVFSEKQQDMLENTSEIVQILKK